MSFHCLPQLELYLSSGTVCLTIYSFVAGIFGVNIPYTWTDNHGYMFKWVSKIFLLGNLAPDYKLLLYGESCVFFFTLPVGNCHRSILCISVPSSNDICSLQGPGWILKGPMFSVGIIRDS